MLSEFKHKHNYGIFLLVVTPFLKKEIEPCVDGDMKASIISGTVSGMGATIASQPTDTIKTVFRLSFLRYYNEYKLTAFPCDSIYHRYYYECKLTAFTCDFFWYWVK